MPVYRMYSQRLVWGERIEVGYGKPAAAGEPLLRNDVMSLTDCLFCNMASGAMEVEKLHDDDLCFAIRDINPRAPVHLLIVSKEHIPTVRDIRDEHGPLLARMVTTANQLADGEGLAERGYRLAFNCGDEGGQTIYHIHLHVLGGRRLGAEG